MKVFKQKDAMQCGVACLAMIINYFGRETTIAEIEEVCHSTISGISLKGIADGAKAFGLESYAKKLTISELIKTDYPCILHWNQKHFVVLYKSSKLGDKFYIADPGRGKYVCTYKDLEEHWIINKQEKNGIVMSFKKNDNFIYNNTHQKPKRSITFLSHYMTKYRKYLIQLMLGLLLGCIFQLITPFLTQCIVDIGIVHKDINLIWLILLGEFMIIIGRTTTDFIRRWILLHISMRINISLVSDFFIKLLKLPMSFFDTKMMGDLLQRMGDHGRVQSFLTNQVLSVLFSFLSFVVFGLVLLVYNRFIFCVFALSSIFYGLWILRFLKKRKLLDYELFEQNAINQSKTYQFLTSIQEIKLQNCELRRRWEWEDIQASLFNIQMKALKLQQTQEAGSICINEIKNILITVLAATSVINGQISLGVMLAIQYIVGQLNSPIEQLMNFIYSAQDVKISLERINEIHVVKDENNKEKIYPERIESASIIVNNLTFKYNFHSNHKIINQVSAFIPQGKITAIVGASGSGKTTLIKLLLGYYNPLNGSIIIANKNLADFDLKWWRSHCGVVMQDGVIFSESIARNIAIGDEEIDNQKLLNAAKIACIHDFIDSLPLQYHTKIGRDGLTLSQGQKQRILIARAVYKDPNFIFLDEATNALDATNEKQIVENLSNFYRGRTVIIVAHRLSTVKNADQIIVLESGKIVESGTHDSLVSSKGSYYNLVKNQLELGI